MSGNSSTLLIDSFRQVANHYFIVCIRFDKSKLRFDIDLILPRLRIMAKYKVTGQLLNFLSVNGSGNMDANVSKF